MKPKLIFIIIFIFSVNISLSQRYYKTRKTNIGDLYVPIDLNLLKQAANRHKVQYENNLKYIDNLIDLTYKLRAKTNDKEFYNSMERCYKKLRAFDGKDVSRLSIQIRQIELEIKEEVFKYNEKIRQYNQEKSSNMQSNENNFNYMFKTTFDSPPFDIPLRAKPNVNSLKLYVCPKNSIVYVIDNSGSIYFKVFVDGHIGYVSKGFLRRTK